MNEKLKKSVKRLIAESLETTAAELERLRALSVEAEEGAHRRHTELVSFLVDLRADFADLRKDLRGHKADTEHEFKLRPVSANGASNGNGKHRD